jgi:hypothetical protein
VVKCCGGRHASRLYGVRRRCMCSGVVVVGCRAGVLMGRSCRWL